MVQPSEPPEDQQPIDARDSQGFLYQPSGPVEQVFGTKVETGGGDYVVYNITTTVVSEAQVKTIEDLPPEPGDPPFQGLQYFDESDADRFFGREDLTARIVARLGRSPFLAVIGASGSGKSSVLRAGVIPALRRGQRLADGGLPPTESPKWSINVFTPTAHPLDALAAALLPEPEQLAAMTALRDQLAQDPGVLPQVVSQYLSRQKSPHLLLFVDQFEELYTLCRKPEEREAFIAGLLAAAAPGEAGQTSLLIALRADYYAQVAQNDRLRETVSQSQEFIGAMSRAELVRAIDRPLAQGNWQIQQGLIEVILDDIGYEPGALPLLSHALHETWLRRRGRTLTLSGYTEAGGVRGAVAQTAEAVYRRLPPEQQPVARSIFLRMAEVGQDSQDTRRRATYDELITRSTDELVINAVVKVLTDARLVTTDTLQPGGQKVVQVSHECLIREWPTLRAWIDEDCESLILHQRLAEAADEWQKLGRDPGALYRSARLKAAQEWAAGRPDSLSLLEQDFLEASRQVAEQEVEQSRRLGRAKTVQRVFSGVTAVLLIAVAYLAYTYFFNKQPAVMDGFFNIAIASVSGPNTSGDETGPGLSELLYAGLRSELGNSPNVLVWRDSPDLRNLNVTIGPVEGNTPEARSLAAAQIASRLHADMVIYGADQAGLGGRLNTAVESSADDRKYSLEFFLAPRQGYDFEDLEGGFDLGCPISLASQPNAAAMQSELTPCTSALAWIALGLSEAQVGHSLEALEAFLKAAPYIQTSEVIQFLIGREYLFLVDRESVLKFVQDEFYAQAAEAFTLSTTLNPDYPRAYIGLGAVYFKQARDLTLQDDPSPEQLNQAMLLIEQSLAANQKALENAGNPGTTRLPIESVARLGLGNGLQWKGRILLYQGQSEKALQNFKHSIQELEPIVQSFQQAGQARYLAQTYEILGSAYQWKGYTSELGQAYADGLAAYQSALTYFDLCIAEAESTQDFIIKENVVSEVCQPNWEYVREQIARLGGTQ